MAPTSEHLLILLSSPEPQARPHIEKLRQEHPGLKITYRRTGVKNSGSIDQLPEDIFDGVTLLYTLFVLPALEKAKDIKLIHLHSAGVEHMHANPIYTDTKIPLTSSSGIHGPPISEWVVMQILVDAHEQKKLLAMERERRWVTTTKHAELAAVRDQVGLRLGILGYGSIGRQTAVVCKALGMDVIAYTASLRTTAESKKDPHYIVAGTGDPDGLIPSKWYGGLDKESLHDFLSQDIDILLMTLPLSKETRHLLSAPEFEILGRKGKNAYIINVSRGGIINQQDLITYLKKPASEGGLRGAALDVADPEPLGADSELWDLDNCTVTPHVSGWHTSYYARAFDICSRNITELKEGRALTNLVAREKGY